MSVKESLEFAIQVIHLSLNECKGEKTDDFPSVADYVLEANEHLDTLEEMLEVEQGLYV